MGNSQDETGLQRFRDVIYGAYSTTHTVYSSDEQSENIGRRLNIRRFLSANLPADRSSAILDFGCGDGLLLSVAEELGYKNLVGIDLSEGLLAKASRRSSAVLHQGDALAFVRSSPDEGFDVIIAFDVLEHLTRPELLDATREFARALRPGGLLLLHVPNGASPFYGGVRWGDITHELAFTRSSLQQVLALHGLESIETFEERPVAHGLKSLIRAWLWLILRGGAVLRLAAETGQVGGHVLTINMYARARKPLRAERKSPP